MCVRSFRQNALRAMMQGHSIGSLSLSSGEQIGWILHSAGRRFGPLTEDELRSYFRAGMVKSVDRISAPGSALMRAAGEIAAELGESVPEGPPPPEPLASSEPVVPAAPAASIPASAPAAATDAAAEAERQARAARAIAAMKVDLAVLGAQPRTRKSSGWLLPVLLVGSLVVAMLVGLNLLKKMSGQAGGAHPGTLVDPDTFGAGRADASVRRDAAPAEARDALLSASADPHARAQENVRQAAEYVRASNWAGLATHARQWAQAQPDRKEPWEYLGSAYARLGDFNAAADALTKALALDPSDEAMRSLLADVYLQGGRHLEAVGLYKQIVASKPNDARVWNNYGSALMGAGQTTQAIAALETAVRLDPGFKLAWNSLGNAYTSIGDPARASAAFANAR